MKINQLESFYSMGFKLCPEARVSSHVKILKIENFSQFELLPHSVIDSDSATYGNEENN